MVAWFEGFVAGGGLATLALAVLSVEAVLILAFRARLGSRATALLVNVATGAALMLIVRAALTGGSPWLIAALFTLAFALHLLDAAMRLAGR